MARHFNSRERISLYFAADGRCEICGTELQPGWHGDHITPYSAGGPTDVVNGQALCPTCNLKKGATVHYNDAFSPRRFQRETIEAVLEAVADGKRSVTVALGTPGTGKELTAQATATELIRAKVIDHVAVFVPRVALAQQFETNWMRTTEDNKIEGNFRLFDGVAGESRLGKVRHKTASDLPLIHPDERWAGTGFVSTYSSLTIRTENEDNPFLKWARENKGRFLLVADEAQFCGAQEDEGSGGTRAGTLIEEMAGYAAHTLLLTGTPYRADGRPLVLCNYDTDSDGKKVLRRHVEATYADGIALKYLREVEFEVVNGTVAESEVTGKVIDTYEICDKDTQLKRVLKMRDTWQRLADDVMAAVAQKQLKHKAYRGLISCMEKNEAKAVANYLKSAYPGKKIYVSLSGDGDNNNQVLRDFKVDDTADVLVTVRKAFIGYDCKSISVVGIFTHYRDKGHLMQLIGRGLRVWDKTPCVEQMLTVIAPNDIRMQEFIDWMLKMKEEGIRERQKREEGEGGGLDGPDTLTYISGVEMTDSEVHSEDHKLSGSALAEVKRIQKARAPYLEVSELAGILREAGVDLPEDPESDEEEEEEQPTPGPSGAPRTDKEIIGDYNKGAMAEIRAGLSARGWKAKMPGYDEQVSRVTGAINDAVGFNARAANTVDKARKRYEAARRWRKEGYA